MQNRENLVAAMEECHRAAVPYSSIREGGGIVILFAPGSGSFTVYNPGKNKSIARTAESPILNIEFVGRTFVVFFQHSHDEYDARTLQKTRTVSGSDVLARFSRGRKTSLLIREKELLVAKEGEAPVAKSIRWAALVDKDHLAVCRRGKISVYTFRGKVFSVPAEGSGRAHVGIRNNKVYVLQDARITGHDLNLYLDVLGDFRPDRFTNIEGEIILFDSLAREVRLYRKSLESLLFACSADDYRYSTASGMLFTVFESEFVAYKRDSVCSRKFELIEKSVVYVEQEDEFDESDSSHVDLLGSRPK